MKAKITCAEGVPGLFDIVLEDGREFRDMTTAQTGQLIADLDLHPDGGLIGVSSVPKAPWTLG